MTAGQQSLGHDSSSSNARLLDNQESNEQRQSHIRDMDLTKNTITMPYRFESAVGASKLKRDTSHPSTMRVSSNKSDQQQLYYDEGTIPGEDEDIMNSGDKIKEEDNESSPYSPPRGDRSSIQHQSDSMQEEDDFFDPVASMFMVPPKLMRNRTNSSCGNGTSIKLSKEKDGYSRLTSSPTNKENGNNQTQPSL